MSKTNSGTGTDLIKALRCLASQDCYGNCYMDKYNRYTEDYNHNQKQEPRMSCSGSYDGTIRCPYYQHTYGVCFEDGDCMEWLNATADLLERLLNDPSGNPRLNAARKEIELRMVASYGKKRQGLLEAHDIISNYITNGAEIERIL